jgi:hypothetical protein
MASHTKKGKGPPEALDTRCPRLGGTVPFRYCLAPGEPTPCFKILDCWWEIFDVVSYMQARLPPEDFESLLVQESNRPDRLGTILELIERHKKAEPGNEEG